MAMTKPTKSAELASHIRGPEDFAAAFDASRETLDRLATYEQLLRQWQKTINLVAPSTLDAIWHRHFADSAQLLSLAPQAANLGGPRLRRRFSGDGGGDLLADPPRRPDKTIAFPGVEAPAPSSPWRGEGYASAASPACANLAPAPWPRSAAGRIGWG